MTRSLSKKHLAILFVGIALGIAISHYWPHEPALAGTSDRNSKFAMTSCPVSFTDGSEAIFVLDFLTGRLAGASINTKTNTFTHSYFRNVAADFGINPQAEPQYAIITASGKPISKGPVQFAQSMVYIAELNSGKVIAYGLPNKESQKQPTVQLAPIAFFSFREANIQN